MQRLRNGGPRNGEGEASTHGNSDEDDPTPPQWTLRQLAASKSSNIGAAIRVPGVAANNLNITPNHISLVQQNTFHGGENEDPHEHLLMFEEVCLTIKLNEVSPSAIRLLLFPFSLKDRARKWYGTLKKGSIRTWEEMAQTFLTKYFPHKRTAKIRTQISSFRQRSDETLSEAWERFRDLEFSCLHHGLPIWFVIQSFYDGLTDSTRMNVDAVSGGSLMDRDVQAAFDLIDDLARKTM